MEISLKGVVVIVGSYGSGKSEVAINLAVHGKRSGLAVQIADLDLVNPYFRSREARSQLRALGVEVVLPPEHMLQADLPVLSPAIAGMIRRPSQLSILDVGGDKVGATVLAALRDAFDAGRFRLLQVVNPFRPYTDTVAGCLKIKAEIEAAARLRISGLIGNANLIEETTEAEIYGGYEFVRTLAAESGLALEFICVPVGLISRIDPERFACAVLPIRRQLVPPWGQAVRLDTP